MSITFNIDDKTTLLVSEQHDALAAYNEVMSTIRDLDVEDVIRESPAFVDESDC